MNKRFFAGLILGFAIIFSGCGEKAPAPTPTPSATPQPTPVTTIPPVTENTLWSDYSTDVYHTMNYSDEHFYSGGYDKDVVTFLSALNLQNIDFQLAKTRDDFITISQIHNGENTVGDFDRDVTTTPEELASMVTASNNVFYSDDTQNILYSDYLTPSSTGYDKLKDLVLLRTNAQWDITPAKVEYTAYFFENSKGDEKFAQRMKEALDKACPDTNAPIVLWDKWSFDYNGKKISVVNASNFSYHPVYFFEDENVDSRYPATDSYAVEDKHIIYSCTAVFADNEIIHFRLNNEIQYLKDVWSDYEGGRHPYTYQYNNNGQITAYPVKVNNLGHHCSVLGTDSLPVVSLVADIENDGMLELFIVENDILITDFTQYRIDKNFNFEKVKPIDYFYGVVGYRYPLWYVKLNKK